MWRTRSCKLGLHCVRQSSLGTCAVGRSQYLPYDQREVDSRIPGLSLTLGSHLVYNGKTMSSIEHGDYFTLATNGSEFQYHLGVGFPIVE